MIYKKDANFPYPLLTNTSNSYEDSNFILEVELQENIHNYRFDITYEIDSIFINNHLKDDNIHLVLVIQSKDNKVYRLNVEEKFIEIPKSRISINKRTTLQLLIQSKKEVTFKDNEDLSPFYNDFKDEIVVPKNSILGFSNTVIFEGSYFEPLNLFEKRVDENIKSDVKIQLGSESIIINYKNERLQFNDSPISSKLNNPYVYMGLQKALYRFIINYREGDGEDVYIEEMEPPTDGLDFKLYNLMKKKMIDEINVEKIDEVIYSISDKILERYMNALRGQIV